MCKENKPSVLLVYTGGTIGMIKDHKSGTLKPVNFAQILEHIPELAKFGYTIDSLEFNPPVDSSDVNPETWIRIATTIQENYSNYDGFVILHGTDTMAYSASALSFMLENLGKPVIFTGAQLPIGTLRTDGKENLVSSIEIAAYKIDNKAVVPEVCIYFENKLFRGNRTSKHNAEYFNAFRSDNFPTLAEAGINIHFNFGAIHYGNSNQNLVIHTKFDNNVGILKIFPGISRRIVNSILNTENLRAVVLETFGAGNAPTLQWFITEIKEAISKGIIFLNISQCNAGSVQMGLYQTSMDLEKIGVISGKDMTTEAAITKLMWLLGEYQEHDKIVDSLKTSISGEINK